MAWFFPICYFLERCSLWVLVYIRLESFFQSLEFFFHVNYPFDFSVIFFLVLSFISKLFLFLFHSVVYLSLWSLLWLVGRIFSCYLVGPILFALLDAFPISFELPFFRQYLLVYLVLLYCQPCLLLYSFGFFLILCPCVFILSFHFCMCLQFLYLSLHPHSPYRFCIPIRGTFMWH